MNVFGFTSTAKNSPPLSLCKKVTEYKKQREQQFFSLLLYANLLNFRVYKTLEVDMLLVAWEFSHTRPCPSYYPKFIHSQSYILLMFSTLYSLLQTEHYFSDSQICLNTQNQPFKNTESPEGGTWNLFLKISPGDSYGQSHLLSPIPDYYLEISCVLKETEADILWL